MLVIHPVTQEGERDPARADAPLGLPVCPGQPQRGRRCVDGVGVLRDPDVIGPIGGDHQQRAHAGEGGIEARGGVEVRRRSLAPGRRTLARVTGFNEVAVRPLHVAEADAAGGLLTASHHEYPAFRRLFPDPALRSRVMRSIHTAAARDVARHGRALTAHVDGLLVGVAFWLAPGQFPLSPARKARMTWPLARAAATAPSAFARLARTGAAMERSLPDERFWYLMALGVHPDAQRRGVGAALLTASLAMVDTGMQRCYLHTSDPANVVYYQRWGFEPTEVIRAGPTAPPYQAMFRPAARHN